MRNIFKRTLAIVIALTMLLCTAPLSEDSYLELPEWLSLKANAEEATEYIDGMFTYTVTDGKATITKAPKYEFYMNQIEIPAFLGGYPVTEIGENAFTGNNCSAVIIPDSVTTINDYAFFDGSDEFELFIGKGVTTISEFAFYQDTIKNIYVSAENPMFSSEDGVLFNKDKSTLIKYPSENTRESYSFPETVTTIGRLAFGDCYQLDKITLNNKLKTIEDCAFYGSIANKEIVALEENGEYSSQDGVLFDKDKTTLIHYYNHNERTSYIVPNTVKAIADNAFEGASNLQEIVFPDGLVSIGNSALSGTYLSEVVIPENVDFIGASAFLNCYRLTGITVAADNEYYSSQDGVLFNKDKTFTY